MSKDLKTQLASYVERKAKERAERNTPTANATNNTQDDCIREGFKSCGELLGPLLIEAVSHLTELNKNIKFGEHLQCKRDGICRCRPNSTDELLTKISEALK